METPQVLVSPRSVTARPLDEVAELQPLRAAGYRLVAAGTGTMPSEQDLLALLPPCVGWLAGVEPVTARVLDAAPRLRAISRNGTGLDNIDLGAAAARGVVVERAAGANAQGVAELTFALVLAALRGIPWSADALRSGVWERAAGRELGDTTIGVVGLGEIGRRVARGFTALGARVVGHDPFVTSAEFETTSLEGVLDAADVLTLHVPALHDGPLITVDAIARLRDRAVLVNTARAALVDDDAVLAALESGHLSAYAVDVFDTEPPAPSRLLGHPHVLATPHLGGYTDASIRRAVAEAAHRLVVALAETERR
ncbi:MAG TPA: NAD(P)-dependent oxidoreductase [Amnibacterium sp.]|jgi:D-3-phosphoglycerate dehydrogenase|nr:NAD(P)-dependent oxidoreductase [Amnibacterium sp.]